MSRISHEHQENQRLALADNPWLRREAGEEWHPDGLNVNLLAAIVLREQAIDKLAYGDSSDEQTKAVLKDQIEHVRSIKEERGIGDPPTMSAT